MSGQTVPESLQVLALVARILNSLKVDYFLTGSLASSVRGEFRATNDIDIVAAIDPQQVSQFIEAFSSEFYVDEIELSKALQEERSFNLIHESTMMKVDFFTKIGERERKEIERATLVTLPGLSQQMPVATAEDVIISKLLWYKSGGESSERQWRDILGVIVISGAELDHAYLRSWAGRLGLEALLKKAFQESAAY